MKFKIGDRVWIKTNGQFDIVDMDEYKGKSAIITKVIIWEDTKEIAYTLDIDKGHWLWREELIEDNQIEVKRKCY